MGRDITFYRAKRASDEDETDEDYYEKRHIVSVGLGSGDAWPCYIRPFFIAAYRRLKQILDEDRTEDVSKPDDWKEIEAVLDAIVRCCPPDNSHIDNRKQSCGFFGHVAKDFTMLSPTLKGRHDQIDETVLFRAETQLLMERAGLWPCVELLLMHHRCPFVTPTIRRVSAMMQLLKDFVPYETEHLNGTPYEGVDNDYNLADERWVELIDAFELASKEDNVVGMVE